MNEGMEQVEANIKRVLKQIPIDINTYRNKPNDAPSYKDYINQILSIPVFSSATGALTLEEVIYLLQKGQILIKDPDQSLPKNVYEPPLDITQEAWRDIIEATYKLMLKERWVKVLKEEK